MLINLGILASSGSLIAVPNLSGLTKTAAATAIIDAGLTPVDGGSVTTENSNLQDIISSQSPLSGTLVEAGSQVTYIWFNFVPAPPFFPNFTAPPFFPNFLSCTPGTRVPNSEGECFTFTNPDTGQTSSTRTYEVYTQDCTTTTMFESCTPTAPPFFPNFTAPPFFPNFTAPPFFPFFPSFTNPCAEVTCGGLPMNPCDCECIDGTIVC
jgi:hypothetical protein